MKKALLTLVLTLALVLIACMAFAGGKLDAATYSPKNGGIIYFFDGPDYFRFNVKKNKVDKGYPRNIKKSFPGLPFTYLDAAAFSTLKGNVIYMFQGNKYIRYNLSKKRVDPGYPRSISAGFKGIPWHSVDAACFSSKNGGVLYLYKGKQYCRFNISSGKVDKGYPKTIKSNAWKGMPFEYVQAAAATPKNGGSLYFFYKQNYSRFNINKDSTDNGYPKVTRDNFSGLYF